MGCAHKKSVILSEPNLLTGKPGWDWCPMCGATRMIRAFGKSGGTLTGKWKSIRPPKPSKVGNGACLFKLAVQYDPKVTDPASLAVALDRLLATALSTEGILDEYGNPEIGEFLPED